MATAPSAAARPAEAEAFLTALQDTPPGALTACPEWTAHDIGAHLAGGYEEVIRHVRAYGESHPLTTTRSFEEREAPFKDLPPARLLAAVEHGEQTMRAEISAVLATQPDAVLAWTGRQMRVDAFLTHLRSECALHRWDLCGDDPASWDLLSQYNLLKHAVTAIGAGPMCARGIAAGAAQGPPLIARVRSDGHPDLLVTLGEGNAHLELTDPAGDADITTDQAARLLLFWGRTAQPAIRLHASSGQPDTPRLRRLFSGY